MHLSHEGAKMQVRLHIVGDNVEQGVGDGGVRSLDRVKLPLSRVLHEVCDVLHALKLAAVVVFGTDLDTRTLTLKACM